MALELAVGAWPGARGPTIRHDVGGRVDAESWGDQLAQLHGAREFIHACRMDQLNRIAFGLAIIILTATVPVLLAAMIFAPATVSTVLPLVATIASSLAVAVARRRS